MSAYSKTYKQEVVASRAVVASNHPLASVAGVETLLRGGNAVDASVATLFALSVVEPMMVSPFGAGFFTIRDGRTGDVTFLDDYAAVPFAATPDMFDPIPGDLDFNTTDGANMAGYLSVATPGALAGWAEAVQRFGRLPLAQTIEPAIRYAAAGFAASGYLVQSIRNAAKDLARFPASAEVFLPGGKVPEIGQRIVRTEYARTLQQIADGGPDTMYTGALARAIADDMRANGGLITLDDLAEYRVVERAPVRGTYRGYEIISTAPPSSGGTHIVQLLNLLEAFPIGKGDLAFGQPGYVHLLAEGLKIAFADRRRYMADPDRVDVPVSELISRAYAERRRAGLDLTRAQDHAHGEFAGAPALIGAGLGGQDGTEHDPLHGDRRRGHDRRVDADAASGVRLAGDDARDRDAAEQPHEPDGPDARQHEQHRARQAHPLLDVADDHPEGRQAVHGARDARRQADLRGGGPGHPERDRPRDDAPGGVRGAARLDGGRGAGA